jgi:CYTH domain-containing protein
MLVTHPGKHAKAERERRFLVPTMPTGLGDPWEIHDRYIIGTRLRLRRVEASEGTVLKLGQKIRPDEDNSEMVLCTSLYLSQVEYDSLAVLPADILRKARYRIAVADFVVCVDVFHDGLAGFILAEVDLATDSTSDAAFEPPTWCGPEVTSDERFTGGALAALDADGAQRLLDEVAVKRMAAELNQTTMSNRATYDRIAVRYAENQDRLLSGNERAFPELLRAFVASLHEEWHDRGPWVRIAGGGIARRTYRAPLERDVVPALRPNARHRTIIPPRRGRTETNASGRPLTVCWTRRQAGNSRRHSSDPRRRFRTGKTLTTCARIGSSGSTGISIARLSAAVNREAAAEGCRGMSGSASTLRR